MAYLRARTKGFCLRVCPTWNSGIFERIFQIWWLLNLNEKSAERIVLQKQDWPIIWNLAFFWVVKSNVFFWPNRWTDDLSAKNEAWTDIISRNKHLKKNFWKHARIFEPGFMFNFMHAGVWARARGLRSNVRARRGVVAMSEMMSLDSSNGSDSADVQQIFEVQNVKRWDR